MLKKITKLVIISFMIIGLFFSILNIIEFNKAKAVTKRGVWNSDIQECEDIGDECDITGPPKPIQ